jgi:hypothetical protein
MTRWLSSRLVGSMLALAALSGSAIALEPARTPDFRLSGTVVAGAEARTAIIKLRSGATQIIPIGEPVPGWGPISDIQRDSIRVSTGDGEYRIWVTAGEADPAQTGWFAFLPKPSPSVAPPRAAEPSPQSRAQTRAREHYPEFRAEVERLAAADAVAAKTEDLNKAVLPLFGLSAAARIVEVNHIPVPQAGTSPADIKRMLEAGTVVRLTIEGVAGVDAVYITPPSRGPAS